MTAKLVRCIGLLAVAVLAVVLAFGRQSKTQPTTPAPAAYDYKVELVKHRKDLEGLLKEDGRNGWRVERVVATGPSDNELVVILERAGSTP